MYIHLHRAVQNFCKNFLFVGCNIKLIRGNSKLMLKDVVRRKYCPFLEEKITNSGETKIPSISCGSQRLGAKPISLKNY